MAVMIMNDYYVIQYLRKVSLGGEGGARVGGAAACSVRERAAAACSRAASARACSSSGVPWGEGGSSKR